MKKRTAETIIVNKQSGDQTAPTLVCCCCCCSCFCALDATTDDSEKKSTTKYLTPDFKKFKLKTRLLVRYLNIHTGK